MWLTLLGPPDLDQRLPTLSPAKTISVTDPPVGTSNGSPNVDLGLLLQYMASSFVAASGGHEWTPIADPPPNQQLLLAQPHA
jgi:hypothetical protein